MPRKDENLSRYLSDMVRYGYWTNEELKRVQNTPMPPIEHWSREYHLEAQIRHARYQIQLDDINGMVFVVPHYACRPSHIQYQGKSYRRSTFDNDIAYPNNPDGIGCTNCRHEVTAYYRGIDKQYDESLRNTDELIKQYNDEQKMRYYERNIRKLKLAGEGNDESIRNYYAKMMKHSRDTNTPIQINRTWTISASRYNISMSDRRLDMMNLLPRTTNESFDYGFVKTTARMSGKRKSYFIDNIDISEINFAPESIRTAYTGRAYGVGRAMTEEAYKSSLETLLHTSANSEGLNIIWADKTTTNLLNATGCFYIPKNTDVDSINPFDVYDDFKKYQTEDLLPTSYGIYVDDNDVWRFFYGDKVESDIIYDFSRKPNRQKVSPKIMDTPIKTFKELSEKDYLRYQSKSSLLKDRRSIRWFNQGNLIDINDNLRQRNTLDDIKKIKLSNIDMLSEATKKDFVAYRFIDEDVYKKIIKGKDEFYDLGFTHTSVLKNKSNLYNKPIELRINVPKGTKGFFTHNIDESEFILDRGSMFKVISEASENGKNIVYLEVKMPEVVKPAKDIEIIMENAHDQHIRKSSKVVKRPCTTLNRMETFDEIVQRLGGADDTMGSCVSVALAYIARKKGLDVLDYRGGTSCEMFAKSVTGKATLKSLHVKKNIQLTGKYEPARDSVLTLYSEKGEILNKIDEWMLDNAEDKKEYFCIAGNHCSIIRVNKTFVNFRGQNVPRTEYLELQNVAEKNGWDLYTPNRFTSQLYGLVKHNDYLLVPVDDWLTPEELSAVLEYINNEPNKQKKNSNHGGIK